MKRFIWLFTALAMIFISMILTGCDQSETTSNSGSGTAAPVTNTVSTTGTVDATEPSNEVIKELFEKSAKKLIQYSTSEPSYVLNTDFDNKLETGEEKTINDRPYNKTNLNYQQAVDKYSELFTGNFLDEFLLKYFYNLDGVLYVTNAGGATGFDVANVQITYINQNNGEYSYKVTFDKVEGVEEHQYVPQESQFSVKKVENNYRISGSEFHFGP